MNCSAGVLTAAIVVLLGALLTYVMAAGILFTFLGPMQAAMADAKTPLPPGLTVQTMKYLGIAMAVVFASLATLGAATGVGLIRLWRWSRYSIVVWGGILTAFGAMSMIMIFFMPMPTPDGNPAMLKVAKLIMAGFYSLGVAVGLWFLIFFTRKNVVEQFLQGGSDVPPIRPVSVTVIAWLMIIGGAGMPLAVLLHVPAMFCGLLMQGTTAGVFYAGYGAGSLAVGIGLLRLKRLAYWGALGYYAFGLLNGVATVVPAVWQRYDAALRSFSPFYPESSAFATSKPFMLITVAFSVGVPLLFLLLSKRRYLDACSLTSQPS